MGAGKPVSFDTKFKFVVRIGGFNSADFTTCTELSKEIGVVMHRQGGRLLPNKTPGLMEIPNVTLTRGASSSREFYDWFKRVADTATDGEPGLNDDDATGYTEQVDIDQLGRNGEVLRTWRCYDVWPKKISAGDWDNDAEEVRIESLELVVDRWELLP